MYVSQAWGGRTSDKHITANSPGLTTKLKGGDELMADRGFAVHDLFADMGEKVTIPDFKGQGRTKQNERKRIRKNRRSKNSCRKGNSTN